MRRGRCGGRTRRRSTLKSGEERDDLQFVLDLSALHTVSGHVGATDQGNIAAGMVRLTDSQDSSLSRMAMIQPDGSFVVQWVPAGTYTLAVSNASNVPSQGFGRRGQNRQRRDELCAVPGEPDGDRHGCERGGSDADSGDRVVSQ